MFSYVYVVDCWHRTIDADKFIVVEVLDLAKACANHGILLAKLTQYDIMGITHSWFESFLFNQKLCIDFKHLFE